MIDVRTESSQILTGKDIGPYKCNEKIFEKAACARCDSGLHAAAHNSHLVCQFSAPDIENKVRNVNDNQGDKDNRTHEDRIFPYQLRTFHTEKKHDNSHNKCGPYVRNPRQLLKGWAGGGIGQCHTYDEQPVKIQFIHDLHRFCPESGAVFFKEIPIVEGSEIHSELHEKIDDKAVDRRHHQRHKQTEVRLCHLRKHTVKSCVPEKISPGCGAWRKTASTLRAECNGYKHQHCSPVYSCPTASNIFAFHT